MVSTSTLYSRICLRPVLSTARFDDVPTLYIRDPEQHSPRSTFGISKILPSLTPLETAAQNSMKLPRSPGIITCSMFSQLRAALAILLCGICGASERLLVLCTEEVPEHLVDPQATPLAEWLLVVGGV